MIINKKIEIKTTNKNIGHYKKYYPNIKSGDTIIININQLPNGSKYIVDVKCDICDTIKSMMYKTYLRITKTGKYYCSKCKGEKIKNTCQEKYGVDNVFQLESVKEKSRETCNENYGKDYYQSTDEYKIKVKETSNIIYGYDYPMQNKDICQKSVIKNNKIKKESTIKSKKTRMEKYKKLFIIMANKVHNNKYDYSLSNYINMHIKIDIICNDHGIFTQRPKDHIHSKQGCPKCNTSKGELEIIKILGSKNILFETQKEFDDCKNVRKLPFDFYLPEYNICIEYDGEQHFRPYNIFGGDNKFEKRKYLDNIKTKYCKDCNIELIRIRYDENIEEKLKNIFKS